MKNILDVPVAATTRHLPLLAKRCVVCRKRFKGTKQQVYCARACQNRAYYQRQKQQKKKEG